MKIILTIKAMLIIGIPVFSQQMVDWSPLNLNEPTNLNTRTISVVDSNTIWGALTTTLFTGNMVFKTLDGGQNFDVFTLPFESSDGLIFDIFALDQNTAYTASSTGNGAQVEGIHRTTDGGQNWDLIFSNEEENFTAVKVYFFNMLDGFVYGAEFGASSTAGFFHTTDGGDTWTKSESEFVISTFWTEGGNDGLTVLGDTAWCSNVNDQVFRSVDKGITWITSPIGSSNRVINDIAFKNNSQGFAISSSNINGIDISNVLYKTDDGGLNWSTFSTLPNTLDANILSYIPGTEGAYIISSGDEPTDENFLFTLDNGNTWSAGVAPSSLLSAEFLSPTIGFGGTNTNNGGLMKYNDDIFSFLTPIKELVIDNNVLQVYPNPVFAITNVSIDNDWYGELQVQIVDLLGRKVFDSKMEKINRSMLHELDLNDLHKGMYNLLLSTEEKTIITTFIKM